MRVQAHMKFLFTLVFLAVSSVALGQSPVKSNYRSVETKTAVSLSEQQMHLARAEHEVKSHPTNAEAWLDYFTWTERDESLEEAQKQNRLRSIAKEAAKHIKKTSEYHLIEFLLSGKKDSSSIYAALETAADKRKLYPYAIQFAIIINNKEEISRLAMDLETIQPLSSHEYIYHFNVLQSAPDNSIIYAQGLNDLVPIALLQTKGIRTDIKLRYYDGKIDNLENAFLVLTSGKSILANYPKASYSGLLLDLDGKTSMSELEERMKAFDFSFIEKKDIPPAEERKLYSNYLPSIILLYRHYKIHDQQKADNFHEWLKYLASVSGLANEVNKLLEN